MPEILASAVENVLQVGTSYSAISRIFTKKYHYRSRVNNVEKNSPPNRDLASISKVCILGICMHVGTAMKFSATVVHAYIIWNSGIQISNVTSQRKSPTQIWFGCGKYIQMMTITVWFITLHLTIPRGIVRGWNFVKSLLCFVINNLAFDKVPASFSKI